MTKLLLPLPESSNRDNFQNYVELLHADHKIPNQTTNLKIHYNYVSLNSKQKTDPHIDDEKFTIAINDVRNNDKKILSLLRKEMWSTYSFKALQRKVVFHFYPIAHGWKT